VKHRRPILISTVQFHDELEAGRVSSVDLIPVAARLGTDGIELRDSYWTDPEREVPEARRRLDDLGLVVTYATVATLFPGESSRAETVRRHVDTAVELGSPIVRVFHGPAVAPGDPAPWAAAREAVEYAARRGIVVALENLWKGAGRTAAEIRAVLDAIPGPSLGTNVDVGNYYLADDDLPAAIRLLGDRIVYTQLKDNAGDPDGTYLGGGKIPLAAALDALDSLPQSLPYCFEFAGGGEPEARITRSLEYLKARVRPGGVS
jgi:sugar phosphate isomerase/epimerase